MALHDCLAWQAHQLGQQPVLLTTLAAWLNLAALPHGQQDGAAQPTRVGAQAHWARRQGANLLWMALPCVLPLPGIGNVLGSGLMLLAVSMWRSPLGTMPWPSRVAKLSLPSHWARRLLLLMSQFLRLAGSRAQPRCGHWAQLRPHSWMAPMVATMGAVIFLPIPLGNVLPALALVLLGLGLIYQDGLAVLLSVGVALLSVLYPLLLALGAWVWLAPAAGLWFTIG
jgi:hypothetical protein